MGACAECGQVVCICDIDECWERCLPEDVSTTLVEAVTGEHHALADGTITRGYVFPSRSEAHECFEALRLDRRFASVRVVWFRRAYGVSFLREDLGVV